MCPRMKSIPEGMRNLMDKVFLDTNVILDYLIEERDMHQAAQSILLHAVNDELACYASPISLLNIFYILRKQKSEQERKDIIENLMEILNMVPIDYDTMQLGLYIEIPDYEDGIQYISAKLADVRFIISSDKTFGNYNLDIKVITPELFIEGYKK